MKVLIAEDDRISRCMLSASLAEWGYEVEAASTGPETWALLQQPDAPRLLILDWMMPGLDGVEICQRLRQRGGDEPEYVILLTSRGQKADVVEGLVAGANDYITKPFDRAELRARIQVGRKVLELQCNLASRVRELQDALVQVKQLRGLLPICCYCKSVRDDKNYWQQVETYFTQHSAVSFTHGICPECLRKNVEPQLQELRRQYQQGKPLPPA